LAGSTAFAQDDKITFGGAMCMTGAQAPLDTPSFKGAQVAIKELNDRGGLLGKQVEFVNLDGKSTR
jgi:branched-chain amino acid transport system substrate-binding protein